jgi:GH24 family phage-related lysozyme (muramidase)
MDEEKYIWEKEGFRKDPYRVPEGYFADFAGKVMERLKDEAPHTRAERPAFQAVDGLGIRCRSTYYCWLDGDS